MPIYEYFCRSCKKRVEILTFRPQDRDDPSCPVCKGKDLRRLVSRFVSLKSDEARLESLADPSKLAGLDENDPASMAKWLKRMGREFGEDVAADDIDQMADELASGKDLGDDSAAGPGEGLEGGGGGDEF
ncbi:MAG: zinc ribbon domain-containing protein [bacterium]